MKKIILGLSILAIASTVTFVACKKDEVKTQTQTSKSVNSLLRPLFGIGIKFKHIKWDRPGTGCASGFGICNPDKHKPKQFIVVNQTDTSSDLNLDIISDSVMKFTFTRSYQDMGESSAPITFGIDNNDDILMSTEILDYFGDSVINIKQGEYPVYLEAGLYRANVDIEIIN